LKETAAGTLAAEEVPLGEDCKDWSANLNDGERNLLTQIFRFFTIWPPSCVAPVKGRNRMSRPKSPETIAASNGTAGDEAFHAVTPPLQPQQYLRL
jgi:ribonucleotide reductase beta subunit family protein with ferritin-like domain